MCRPHRETAKRTKEEMLLRKLDPILQELSHSQGIRHALSKAPEVNCQLNLRKNSFPAKYVFCGLLARREWGRSTGRKGKIPNDSTGKYVEEFELIKDNRCSC